MCQPANKGGDQHGGTGCDYPQSPLYSLTLRPFYAGRTVRLGCDTPIRSSFRLTITAMARPYSPSGSPGAGTAGISVPFSGIAIITRSTVAISIMAVVLRSVVTASIRSVVTVLRWRIGRGRVIGIVGGNRNNCTSRQ